MRAVKLSLFLLALVASAIFFPGCDTLANRRSMYSPKKGDGYWTKTLHDGSWRKRGPKPADETVTRGDSHQSQPATQPVPPPPPPLPEPAAPAPAN